VSETADKPTTTEAATGAPKSGEDENAKEESTGGDKDAAPKEDEQKS
jgi:hypothetical protein